MLREISDCRQVPNERRRRWFTDEQLDLIVWYNKDDSIHGFQLCYDKRSRERALTWTEEGGYSHRAVDYGAVHGWHPDRLTPILVADGLFDAPAVSLAFTACAKHLDPKLAAWVADKLQAAGPLPNGKA